MRFANLLLLAALAVAAASPAAARDLKTQQDPSRALLSASGANWHLGDPGMSCDDVCDMDGANCLEDELIAVNSLDMLKAAELLAGAGSSFCDAYSGPNYKPFSQAKPYLDVDGRVGGKDTCYWETVGLKDGAVKLDAKGRGRCANSGGGGNKLVSRICPCGPSLVSAANQGVSWHLGAKGDSCNEVCAQQNPSSTCNLNALKSVNSVDALREAAVDLAGVPCAALGSQPIFSSAKPFLNPAGNFGQRIVMSCWFEVSGGNGRGTCDAAASEAQRICPCSIGPA